VFQFSDRSHASPERSHGVFIELIFGEKLSGAAEAHPYTIARPAPDG
jgi:hypothetical protein